MSRLRYDPEPRAYRDRRAKEQQTNKEIMRCLKRYIAREVHRALMAAHPGTTGLTSIGASQTP